jgi:hypothetical protein
VICFAENCNFSPKDASGNVYERLSKLGQHFAEVHSFKQVRLEVAGEMVMFGYWFHILDRPLSRTPTASVTSAMWSSWRRESTIRT